MSAVSFDNVTKQFVQPELRESVLALSGLSFTVDPGEIFGFAGLNGAGKTTAIKILLNLCRPGSGQATVLGGRHAISVPDRIGFAAEIADLPDFLTVDEVLEYACVMVGLDATDALIDRAISLLELDSERSRRVGLLSKGTRQRVSLAAAVVHKPELVILDEPSSGLDPMGRRLIKNLIRELNSEGTTVFFSTHILSDLPGLCHRVAVINRGRQIFVGTPAELCGSENCSEIEECFEKLVRADSALDKLAVSAC